MATVVEGGSGARRQRRAFERRRSLEDVVDLVIAETDPDPDPDPNR